MLEKPAGLAGILRRDAEDGPHGEEQGCEDVFRGGHIRTMRECGRAAPVTPVDGSSCALRDVCGL